MTLRERCLEVERAIYAEDELHEVPLAYQDLWEYLEEISEIEKKEMIVKREGGSSQGGDGWPSTAAGTPSYTYYGTIVV